MSWWHRIELTSRQNLGLVVEMRAHRGNHRWTENDDIVTFYLYKFGGRDLPFSLENVSSKLGMSVGSVRMRIANFRTIDGVGGLEHYGKISLKVYKEYKETPRDELRSLVLSIIKRRSP